MTKTPFEIRFELLGFAQGQLNSEYYAALEQAREIQDSSEREKAIFGLKYPTRTEIVLLAEELKQFVDNK
jgi:hypothetical protein